MSNTNTDVTVPAQTPRRQGLWIIITALSLGVLALALYLGNPPAAAPVQNQVPPLIGVWGSSPVLIIQKVEDKFGGKFYDGCYYGAFGHFEMDATGQFTATGWLSHAWPYPLPAPTPQSTPEPTEPYLYKGQIKGQQMELVVESPWGEVKQYNLKFMGPRDNRPEPTVCA